MSEVNCNRNSDTVKEDVKNVPTDIKSSEDNGKPHLSSISSEAEINGHAIIETSFINKNRKSSTIGEDNEASASSEQSASKGNFGKTSINSNIDKAEDIDSEKEITRKQKCFQCFSDTFECTIWFFRLTVNHIRSKIESCCFTRTKCVVKKQRELDDDDDEVYIQSCVVGAQKDIKESFQQPQDLEGETAKEPEYYSSVNEGFDGIEIKPIQSVSEGKNVLNKDRSSIGNGLVNICPVTLHHDPQDDSSTIPTGNNKGAENRSADVLAQCE